MHTNHRRKLPRSTKRNGGTFGWMGIYSMKPMKRQKSRDRRAHDRKLLDTDRWDDFVVRYPRNIVWEYW